MDNGDIHALAFQAICCFETEKTGSDDDGASLALGDLQHFRNIIEITIWQHARQLMPRHRNDERQGTGGNHQLVVGNGNSVCACDGFPVTIYFRYLCPLCRVTWLAAYQSSL